MMMKSEEGVNWDICTPVSFDTGQNIEPKPTRPHLANRVLF